MQPNDADALRRYDEEHLVDSQVTVRDGRGEVLGAGRTGRTSRPDAGPSCAVRFTTPRVASVDVYQLEVDGTDTTWTFTRADLERDDWEAGLDDT